MLLLLWLTVMTQLLAQREQLEELEQFRQPSRGQGEQVEVGPVPDWKELQVQVRVRGESVQLAEQLEQVVGVRQVRQPSRGQGKQVEVGPVPDWV
jgi:hypothetical protein